MNKHVCFLVLLISAVNILTAEEVLDKYSWQDYKGVIPANALAAGRGKDGKLLFIGQASYEGKLIPGAIYENDEKIYYEFGEQALVANENVKIFCTDHPENFEWISGQIYTIQDLRQSITLIEGGYQKDFLTFIGRVYVEGSLQVGKIICKETADCLGLYTNADGKMQKYITFGVLAYNSKI